MMYYLINIAAPANSKVRLIKIMRTAFDMHLADAKAFVETVQIGAHCTHLQFTKDFAGTMALLSACDSHPEIEVEITTQRREWRAAVGSSGNIVWYDSFRDLLADHGDSPMEIHNIFQDKKFTYEPYA